MRRLFLGCMLVGAALHLWATVQAHTYWGIPGAFVAFMLPLVAEVAVAWKWAIMTGHFWRSFAIAIAIITAAWYPAIALGDVMTRRVMDDSGNPDE